MIAGVADTHAALWFLFGDARLSATAKEFFTQPLVPSRKSPSPRSAWPKSSISPRKTGSRPLL
jgi:hypothetical protein